MILDGHLNKNKVENMKIIELNKDQIVNIYNKMMVHDFPKNELRPLEWILKPYDEGTYICYALQDGEAGANEVLGYAFFVKMNNHYLFDYFAITERQRNNGLGSVFLKLIKEKFACCDSVIGEVEDPQCSSNEEERLKQTRRFDFYIKNGYLDTGVRVNLFGVDYIVLEADLGTSHSKEEISQLYQEHYKSMLSKELYEKMVRIKC